MNATVLIPAAGTGSRMECVGNKQYLQLADRPILAHTLSLFDQHPAITDIFIITPPAEIPFCRAEIVEQYRFCKVRAIIAGGAERQDSVRNGLRACGAADNEIILIHDGVRPFLPTKLIDETIAIAGEVGGCVLGVPVIDTIKDVVDGRIIETPDRRRLWQAQTPQAFPFRIIRDAHERALRDGFCASDDATLVERLGWPVAILAGSYHNIKITTPHDLALAEIFYRQKG